MSLSDYYTPFTLLPELGAPLDGVTAKAPIIHKSARPSYHLYGMKITLDGNLGEAARRAHLAQKLMFQTKMMNVNNLDIIQNNLRLSDGTCVHVMSQHGFDSATIYVPPKDRIAVLVSGQKRPQPYCPYCDYAENFSDGTFDLNWHRVFMTTPYDGTETSYDIIQADDGFYAKVYAENGDFVLIDDEIQHTQPYFWDHTDLRLEFGFRDVVFSYPVHLGEEQPGVVLVHLELANGRDVVFAKFSPPYSATDRPPSWYIDADYHGFIIDEGETVIDLSESPYAEAFNDKIKEVRVNVTHASVNIDHFRLCSQAAVMPGVDEANTPGTPLGANE